MFLLKPFSLAKSGDFFPRAAINDLRVAAQDESAGKVENGTSDTGP
jgi:hypothetical protein